jgi:signal transduction histidine kinase
MVEQLEFFKKSSLIVVLGLFLMAGFFATAIASYHVSKNHIRHVISTRELPLASDNIHSEIQRILLPPLNVSATMAHDVFLRDWITNGEQDVEKVTDYLNEIKTKQGMSSAFVVSEKTQNYYSHNGLRGRIDPQSDADSWYSHCRAIREKFEMNADIDMHVSNQVKLFINYKMYDSEGDFIGITGVATQIESIEELIQRFKVRYPKTIYFVSPEGRVALRAETAGSDLEDPDLASFLGSKKLADQVLSQSDSSLEYSKKGDKILLHSRFLPELNWFLVVEEPVRGEVVHLRRLLILNLAVCLGITALVLSIVYLTVRQYQRRLVEQRQTVVDQSAELAAKNQRLETLYHAQNEFMKMVVHDLKTPLGGMMGVARLIEDEKNADLILDYTRKIDAVGQEMMGSLQTLLDFKAVESAAVPVMERVSLGDVLNRAAPEWTFLARNKIMQVRVEGSDQPLSVLANQSWLHTILNNLVSNAIKYSPERTEIRVKLEARDACVRIWVIDQGPGILPDERSLLFKQFSRLSSRPTAGESSSGLGLYIVKTMVEKLGGSVGVSSEPGRGSQFWIEFSAG